MAKDRNFVAKHSQNKTGAGVHQDKKGEKAPRNRQKREWKKNIIRDMNESVRQRDPFEQAIKEVEKQFGINLQEQVDDKEHGPNPLDLDDELQGRVRHEPEFGTPEFRDYVRKQYHDARDRAAAEDEEDFDPTALDDDQLRGIVDYAHEELLQGRPADDHQVMDALQSALDDVPGFEVGDRAEITQRLLAIYHQIYR